MSRSEKEIKETIKLIKGRGLTSKYNQIWCIAFCVGLSLIVWKETDFNTATSDQESGEENGTHHKRYEVVLNTKYSVTNSKQDWKK